MTEASCYWTTVENKYSLIVSQCVALFKATGVPNSQNLKTGVQFSSTQSTTANDTSCASNFVAPRLTFEVCSAMVF